MYFILYSPALEPVPENNSNNSTLSPLPFVCEINSAVVGFVKTSPSILTGLKNDVVTKLAGVVASVNNQVTSLKEVAPPEPERTSAFKSTINPSLAVSQ